MREGGVLTTLGAGEWLVSACPQGQSVDALFTEVVAAREDLGLIVMFMTNGTCDLLFQFFDTFLHIYLLGHFLPVWGYGRGRPEASLSPDHTYRKRFL